MAELEAEARARQATSAPGVYGGEPLRKIFSEAVVNGRASDHVAELFGTNPQYVNDAKRLKAEAPDLLEQVAAGCFVDNGHRRLF